MYRFAILETINDSINMFFVELLGLELDFLRVVYYSE